MSRLAVMTKLGFIFTDESINTKKEMALKSQFDPFRLERRVITFF